MSPKLSFSIPSEAAAGESTLSFPIPSSRVRARPGGDANKEKLFVTEFDSSIQNTRRPIKRMKLTEAANSEAIGFVVEEKIIYARGRDECGGDPVPEKLRYDILNLENERVGKLGLGFMSAVTGCALPQEMEEAILLGLPVRSLLRFKAVSKEFRSLISSPRFISDHKSKAEQLSIIGCFWNRSWYLLRNSPPDTAHAPVLEAQEYRIGGLPVEHNFHLVGSANGLVCLQPRLFPPDSETRPYVLWNPATRQFKNIPRPGIKGDNDMFLTFGYRNGIQEDYMLFGIPKGCNSIHVFSLRRDSWRTINCCIDTHQWYAFCNSSSLRVVLNGFLYLLLVSYDSRPKAELLVFDCESLTRMSPPAGAQDKLDNLALCVSKERLLLFSLYAGVLNVWVMRKSSWTRVHTADLYTAAGFSISFLRLASTYWQGSRVLLKGRKSGERQRRTWSYDILTSTWIEIHSLTPTELDIFEACDYVESLVPPAGKFLLN